MTAMNTNTKQKRITCLADKPKRDINIVIPCGIVRFKPNTQGSAIDFTPSCVEFDLEAGGLDDTRPR